MLKGAMVAVSEVNAWKGSRGRDSLFLRNLTYTRLDCLLWQCDPVVTSDWTILTNWKLRRWRWARLGTTQTVSLGNRSRLIAQRRLWRALLSNQSIRFYSPAALAWMSFEACCHRPWKPDFLMWLQAPISNSFFSRLSTHITYI